MWRMEEESVEKEMDEERGRGEIEIKGGKEGKGNSRRGRRGMSETERTKVNRERRIMKRRIKTENEKHGEERW